MKTLLRSFIPLIAASTIVSAQTLTPQEIQATVKKAQATLQAVQGELAKISPAPMPPVATAQIEIVPEVLVSKSYRKTLGLVGKDSPVQPHFMVLPKTMSIPAGLEKSPIPPEVQRWADATVGAGIVKGGFFDDEDKNGLTTFEEYAFGSTENPLMCGWVTATGSITIQHQENLDAGITHTIEVGDGKQTWRAGVEGTDYKASDLTGTGTMELRYLNNGVNMRIRKLQSIHPAGSATAFLRVRLSK